MPRRPAAASNNHRLRGSSREESDSQRERGNPIAHGTLRRRIARRAKCARWKSVDAHRGSLRRGGLSAAASGQCVKFLGSGRIRKLFASRARARMLVQAPFVETDRNRARISLLFVARSAGAPPFEKSLRMPGSLQDIVAGTQSRWISKPLSVRRTAEFPVVAIGASAGGLDACRRLLDALPSANGMAFIIVQHLDPNHDSMMVDLLAGHTSMPVLLATQGTAIQCERVYAIPPGVYLSVDDKGALRISKPEARHGARLPFDFLLNSLAREYGARSICVVLSGTGADGSLGLKWVKAKGGLVIAQDMREAGYDGMPRSAVATGAVDLVLRAAKIAEALVARERGQVFVAEAPKSPRSSRWRSCCRTLSRSCARRRFMTSPFTSTARSSGASSGGWRWRGSKPPPSISISCVGTRTNAISSPGTC